MRKFYYILAMVLLLVWSKAGAQTTDTVNNSIGVRNSEGREIVTISKSEDHRNGMSITMDGIRVDFLGNATELIGGKNKKRRYGYSGHLGLLQIGFNGFDSPDYWRYPDSEKGFMSVQNGKSVQIAVNALNISSAITRNGVLGFSAGLGIKWNNFVFDEQITLGRREGMVWPVRLDQSVSKSKLTTFAFTIPVQLEVNCGRFFIAAGVYGDLVTGSHTKTKHPKEKVRRKQYVNFLQGGVMAKVGYGRVYVYGNYGLTNFFQSGKGPKTQPYTIGFGF